MVKLLFLLQNRPLPTRSSDNSLFRLTMAYDGSGRRISKTYWVKVVGSQDWVNFHGDVSAGLLIAFAGYNTVDSGLKYGANGGISSVVIDAAFGCFGSKFASGVRVTDALIGRVFKRSVDNTLQNALNFGTHKAADVIWECYTSDIPSEMRQKII